MYQFFVTVIRITVYGAAIDVMDTSVLRQHACFFTKEDSFNLSFVTRNDTKKFVEEFWNRNYLCYLWSIFLSNLLKLKRETSANDVEHLGL